MRTIVGPHAPPAGLHPGPPLAPKGFDHGGNPAGIDDHVVVDESYDLGTGFRNSPIAGGCKT